MYIEGKVNLEEEKADWVQPSENTLTNLRRNHLSPFKRLQELLNC